MPKATTRRPQSRHQPRTQPGAPTEPLLRIIPLGGVGEIGKNMYVFEYRDEIVVIDCGLMFPDEEMFGIDLVIPDITYLKERRANVKAFLITHAHEDHVGALPYVLPEFPGVPVYASTLARGLLGNKIKEHKLHNNPLRSLEPGDELTIGPFTAIPFRVGHSIPDAMGIALRTPIGIVVHTGDFKFDHTPVDGWPTDYAKLAEFSERGVDLLLSDSTNAERPGWTPSEAVIGPAFDKVISEAEGRVIIATFASLISRVQQVADSTAKAGRKITFAGPSMVDNVKIARKLGYLEIPDDLIVPLDQALHMQDHKVVIMCTGSQGEPSSIVGRLSAGTNRQFDLNPGDTVVLSSHPIPGNEETISKTINRLLRRGAKVIYDALAQVHVSGHASQEEQKLLMNLVRPKHFMPIHGELRHLHLHARRRPLLRLAPLEAGRDDGDAHLVAERLVDDRPEDDVRVGVGGRLRHRDGLVDLAEREVRPAGDVDEEPGRAVERHVLEERRADRRLHRLDRPLLAGGAAGPHERHPLLAHDGPDVGEVDVDEPVHRDDVRDALHGVEEHLVRALEGVGERHVLAGDREQPLVRDHDERVHRVLQVGEPLLGVLAPLVPLEEERARHDADGEGAGRLGDVGDHRGAARAGAAAHPGGDEDHVGAFQRRGDLLPVLQRRLPPDLRVGAGAQAGSGFGGGASGTVFGARGASTFLSRTTGVLALRPLRSPASHSICSVPGAPRPPGLKSSTLTSPMKCTPW